MGEQVEYYQALIESFKQRIALIEKKSHELTRVLDEEKDGLKKMMLQAEVAMKLGQSDPDFFDAKSKPYEQMTVREACRVYLKEFGGNKSTAQVTDALVAGGKQLSSANAKTTVYISLKRDPEVKRLRGKWYLLSHEN